MNNLPRTLRTPLISPYTPYTPNNSNQVKHFEPLGHFCKLKEIDFNALQCVGSSRNRTNRTDRTAQVVIRVEHLGYSEWIEWIERVEMLR